MAAFPCLSFAQGALENPVAGSTESGIGVISGWHCTASIITATIDGASLGKAGSGTGRGDTASICGRSDTGYSLLFNYNALTPGSHTLALYADGQLLETRQFNTVQSGGAEFVTGLSKTTTVADFPSSDRTATLQWSQAKQSFVVTGINAGSIGSGATDVSSLQGVYNQIVSYSYSGSSCSSGSGTTAAAVDVMSRGDTVTILAYNAADACAFTLSYVSGNSTSGFNLIGQGFCKSGYLTSASTSSIRESNNRLYGTLTQSIPGCTETYSF
jgi:hypothetical protein